MCMDTKKPVDPHQSCIYTQFKPNPELNSFLLETDFNYMEINRHILPRSSI